MTKPFPSLTTSQDAVGAAFLVAGMHRSGTSALARVLSLLGAELPKTLAGLREDNPKGFWEPAYAASLNDALLAELGTSWDDVLAFLIPRAAPEAQRGVLAKIEQVITSEYSRERSIVLKEPRMALLLDLWIAGAARLRFAPCVVIPVRNPLEVAASLGARDGMAVGHSLLLWLSYVLSAERLSRGTPRVFLQYSDLLDDWRGVARRIESSLETKFPRWTPAAELEIDAFLSHTDRHQRLAAELVDARADVVGWVKESYAWLRAAATGAEPPPATLDAIAEEFRAATRVFAPIIASYRQQNEQARTAEEHALHALAQTEAQTRDALAQASEARTRSEAELAAQRAHADEQARIAAEQRDLATRWGALAAERGAVAQNLTERLQASEAAAKAAAAGMQEQSARAEDLAAQLQAVEANAASREAYNKAQVAERDAAIGLAQKESRTKDVRIQILESDLVLRDVRVEAAERALSDVRAKAEAHRDVLERRVGHLELQEQRAAAQAEEIARAQHALLRAAVELNTGERERAGRKHAQWLAHRAPRKRWAGLTRAPLLRPLLRRTWMGRAAALLTSGLYAPQDGPGGRGVVAYARGEARAPDPHPLFSDEWYRLTNDDAPRGQSALHYLWYGDAEGRDPHPLFNTQWYRSIHRDALRNWRLTALEHYLMVGARAGLSPGPLFSAEHYIPQSEDVYARGANPLAHYLRIGWREGHDPHPLFRNDWYLARNPDVREAGIAPLVHYVTTGWREGRDPHPLFSSAYYLEHNSDVRASGENPLCHYITNGWREGRRPSPFFDPQAYLDANLDVKAANQEPLTHYLTNGAFEVRDGAGPLPGALLRAAYMHELLENRTPLEAWVLNGAPDLSRHGVAQREAGAPAFSPVPGAHSADLFLAMTGEGQSLEDNYDWAAYERMSATIRDDQRKRIEQLQCEAPSLIDLGASEVAPAARRLRFEQQPAPDVSIILPVYNQLKYTVECLASLSANLAGVAAEIIVIDDASSDETPAVLGAVEGLRLVRNPENLGYLRTVNRAAREARGRVLVILNNDTQVRKNWLKPLLDALKDETIGAAAPKMLFANGRLQEAGATLKADGTAEMIGLFDDPTLPRYNYDRDVDYVSGACIAIRRADFEALSGFDESFAPAYCEDADLCLRVRKSGKRVRYVAASEIVHHLSVSSDAQPNAYKMRQVRTNQQKLLERWGETLEELNKTRVISFYLPQFHTIPENDKWWGAGFTEWRNVTRAAPNFVGHYQPHRPAELGYYDLANPEIMSRQADLARDYGVHGFCYYYYSFSGRRILEMPLERLLQTGKPDLPFCVCWANENWTRTWDGQERDVLLAQNYAAGDDEVIIADLIRYMRMPSYIRINGKPLLVVYRPQLLPNPRRTAEIWRRACRETGLGEIYLAMVEVFEHALTYPRPSDFGFDASIEFPPSGMAAPINPEALINPRYEGTVCDYHQVVRRYMNEPIPGHTRFRGVMPSWDNTARRQDRSYVFQGATPGAFQAWLEAVIESTRRQNQGDERIVFVNAWNEWAEGTHLEPDLRFGRAWLEAVRNAQTAELQLQRGQS